MSDKVLVYIEDRFIRAAVLKVLFERNLEFVEVLDENDMRLKLDLFRETVIFLIMQISAVTYEQQYSLVKSLKQGSDLPAFPVMAIIPDGSVEYVGGAKKAGIEDVILIPEKREMFREFFVTRLIEFMKKVPKGERGRPDLDELRKSILSDLSVNGDLKREIKRAGRGKYSVSFVMGRLAGIHIGLVQDFYDKLGTVMRETDRIVNYDYRTFIVVCPFTIKTYLVEVEKKVRETFEIMFGGYTRFRRLDMYGVTYPDDGKNLAALVEIMEKGVHDSIVISSIQEPLSDLSRERLEEYKNMLKLYK